LTAREPIPTVFDFEAFSVGLGLAIVCGAMSVLVPPLVAPTAALAALTLAAWVSLIRRQRPLVRKEFGSGSLVALGVLGGTALGFLDPPSLLVPFRGLLLAGGLVPLFLAERSRSGVRSPVYSRR